MATGPSPAAVQTIEIVINVYDLLPPRRLSSVLWTIGCSLLHSGVAVNGKEYAYGGHDRRGVTGVYWTKPRFEPPGGTFRTEISQGFTSMTEREINETIHQLSDRFLGPSYNLLAKNCNHFTSALCEQLTSKPAPAWLNRAAGIGLALPCVVPRELVSAPDAETAEGQLLEEDSDEDASMLAGERRRERRERYEATEAGSSSAESSVAGAKRTISTHRSMPAEWAGLRDSTGRQLPTAERASVTNNS